MTRFVGICDDNGICEEDMEKKEAILEICSKLIYINPFIWIMMVINIIL